MAKTAFDLKQEEWSTYHPVAVDRKDQSERWERAQRVAQQAAETLRTQFGATRVAVFGSLVHRDSFNSWSDIDLATWGIPQDEFFRAVAAVTRLSADFKIDIVDMESCRPLLRTRIEEEGITCE